MGKKLSAGGHAFRMLSGLMLMIVPHGRASEPPRACPADSLEIAALELRGLRTTRREVVLRELLNGPGRRFHCSRWELEKIKLEDLDVFADISLETAVRDSQVTLIYTFRELPPYIPFIALAKTEQDGLSLGPALASLNFLGQGIRAEFLSRFGGTTEFQLSLSSRRLGSLPLEYDLAALRVDSYNHFNDFHEDSWRYKLDLAHRIRGRFSLIYMGEIFLVGADRPGIMLSGDPSGGERDFIPRLGAGWQWDGRDRRHNPTRGVYQEFRYTLAGNGLGGPADYSEWLGDGRVYLPWQSRHVLQLAGLYQYRSGVVGRTLGVYDRFHVGGINTLRGYGNDAFQGKSEFLLTLENRMDWLGKRTVKLWRWSGYYGLQGIVGVEAASLWDHTALLERDFHTGVYAGVHILMAGVDRIRLECGSKFAKFSFTYDIGILDKADIQRFRAR
jgi:outer membrane protein assembly factor BamA